MKASTHRIVAAALLAIGATTLQATNTMTLRDVVFTVDTISHVKAGPGTTATHLELASTVSASTKLQVHYLTIDKRAAGVSFRAVTAKDKVAGTETTSNMAKRKSTATTVYFAGCNGDFYSTSGTATNGSSKIGTPTTSCTVDGEVIKTSNSNYQFIIDDEGNARIGRINYYTGTATIGDKVTLFKGINVGAPNNGITIYTPRYWGSTNQTDYTDNCYEVTARLVDGETFACGRKYRMEVTSEPTRTGDMTIPDDGYVIFARGNSTTGCNTGSMNFVKALKPGDIVEFDHIALLGEERIRPMQIVSGNPRTVGEGESLDSEGERTDASALHPRTGIGYSVSGDSIIMMVVEGRLNGSVGVRTSQLADIMRYAKAWEALNLDGGGSSTLYTKSLGVLNRCSDGTERAVGNAMFAVIDIPQADNTISELQFVDWAARLPRYGRYTPHIMGYNQYGLMVNDDIKDYKLSCPPELGEITPDGHTLIATGSGSYPLTVTVGDITATLPVSIDDSFELAVGRKSVVIDRLHPYTISLVATDGIRTVDLDPTVVSWTSDDTSVATVDDNAVVTAVANGTTTIRGEVEQMTVDFEISTQISDTQSRNILADFRTTDWKLTKNGFTSTSTYSQMAGGGVMFDVEVSSTRSLSLSIAPVNDFYFWGLPYGLEYHLTSSGIAFKNMSLNFTDAKDNRVSVTSDAIEAEEESIGTLDFSTEVDIDDPLTYPLRLTSVTLSPSAKAGDKSHIEIPALNLLYDAEGIGGVEPVISSEAHHDGAAPRYYNLQGIRVANPTSTGVYIVVDGSKTAKAVIR